ncbi:unnamed protein product, partial [Owenia fusiformis]
VFIIEVLSLNKKRNRIQFLFLYGNMWTSAIFLALFVGGTIGAPRSLPPLQSLGKSTTEFAFDFYRHLIAADKNTNVFVSPISISTVLSMTMLGARNATHTQMQDALCVGDLGDMVHELYQEFGNRMDKANKNLTLKAANRLFGQTGFQFLKQYLDDSLRYYNSPLKQLNFNTDPEGSRKYINNWVFKETDNKIKNLLPPKSINPSTKLVLTNAIYFQGNWHYRFNKTLTKPNDFFLMGNVNKKVNVSMMSLHTSLWRGYIPEMSCQIVELPYSGNNTAMYILLPDDLDGIGKIETHLKNTSIIEEGIKRSENRSITLLMPRFNLTQQYDLRSTLSAMGMRDLFTPMADLSGIDGRRDLFISSFVHKAWVDVNENGTSAAGATAAITPTGIAPFKVDRPFIFFIRDRMSGAILFLGKIMCPPGFENQCK